MDESLIVDLLWRRSEDALTVCASQFGAYCHRIAMNVMHNGDDADECVNETWLKVWDAIPPAKPDKLRAFIGKVTRNISINRYNSDHAQKRVRTVDIVIDELADIPAPQADDGEITQTINAFLRAEPERNADIFIKRYWYLQSVKDIAVEYGWSENRVAALLFRMRDRLKLKIESEGLM